MRGIVVEGSDSVRRLVQYNVVSNSDRLASFTSLRTNCEPRGRKVKKKVWGYYGKVSMFVAHDIWRTEKGFLNGRLDISLSEMTGMSRASFW